MDLWSSYLLMILNWVSNSFNKSKSIIQINASGSKYGMITKTWKKKIIFPLDHLKAMMPWTFGATNELGGIMYFVWFQKTIAFSFSLLVSWTFQLRKLFIDCVVLKILYWPTSFLSCNSWWPSHCCRRWSTGDHGWIHWQIKTYPFSKCILPRVQWQKKPFLSW
jgi:hypothetical protein